MNVKSPVFAFLDPSPHAVLSTDLDLTALSAHDLGLSFAQVSFLCCIFSELLLDLIKMYSVVLPLPFRGALTGLGIGTGIDGLF